MWFVYSVQNFVFVCLDVYYYTDSKCNCLRSIFVASFPQMSPPHCLFRFLLAGMRREIDILIRENMELVETKWVLHVLFTVQNKIWASTNRFPRSFLWNNDNTVGLFAVIAVVIILLNWLLRSVLGSHEPANVSRKSVVRLHLVQMPESRSRVG